MKTSEINSNNHYFFSSDNKNLTPVERDQMYQRQEVISNRMQWVAIITIITVIAILSIVLNLKDGFLTM